MNEVEPGLVILQQAHGQRVYRDPIELVTAATPGDVPAALERVEAALRDGLHAAGFLSYEAAPAFDPALVTHPPGPLPVLWFGLYQAPSDEPLATAGAVDVELARWEPTVAEGEFAEAIARIHDRIARGETYQVNYTYRLRGPLSGSPRALAERLQRSQQAAYGAYLDLGPFAIACASPELFFELDGERIRCRPMKGTARRAPTPAADEERRAALAASLKDRAENLMIVDMLRNDLGRIARTGSVQVPELFTVERYDQVWQMTSTVEARTDAGFAEILAALFPCASITGAPKVRTMQVIRELEASPRGIYTGAIGDLAPGRQARFNVAIRTVLVDRESGASEFGVGGGIVWDSTAAAEWRECEAKALVLTRQRPRFSLLETLLWEPGRGYLLLARHLARQARSAAYFGLPYDLDAVQAALAADWTDPRRVRLLVDERGLPTVESFAFDPAPPSQPWRVALAPEPVDSADRFLAHKTTQRSVYEQARASRPELDEVLCWNERGELTEGTITNLAVYRDGRWVTPPVSCGLLAGVWRELAVERGWLSEGVIRCEELSPVTPLLLFNSLRRWIEAVVVE